MDVLSRVKGIASTLSGVAVEDIGDHQPLDAQVPDGLGLDSLDRLELAIELEEAFCVEIPDSDIDGMEATPVGVVAYLKSKGVQDAAPLH